jgi:hypothetical protein
MTLDLYGGLNSMPKYHDQGPTGGDDGDEAETEEREGTPSTKDKPVTKRMLGRMKNKRALERLTSSVGTATATAASSPGEGAEDRGVKRLKEDIVGQQDEEMS